MGIQRAVENVGSRLQDGLAFLATVAPRPRSSASSARSGASTTRSPPSGIAGQASIDKVAGRGEALIMTAFGLAVAVPAVLAYNWLVRRNKVGDGALRGFSADLHLVMMSGHSKKAKA